MKKSFAIVGSGAVGSYYGGRLAEAGNEVKFLLRSDYEVVMREGLRVESVAGNFHLEQVDGARDSGDLGVVDVVLVTWKATANEHYERVIRPLVGEKTIIVTMQNGLGNIEALGEIFGEERVLGVTCFVCLNRIRPGLIRHTAGGMIVLGEVGKGVTERMRELQGIFAAAKVECQLAENFGEAQWRKLVWNVPFNGLCITEGGIDTAELLEREGGEKRVRELMGEVIRAAAAMGYEIEEEFIEKQLARTYAMQGYRPSSMLDYVNGTPVEVEAIWGESLRRAEAAGVAAPHMRTLYEEIKACVERR